MCRNIKPLFNFAPPATEEEIRAAALQFIRKISGFQKPSEVNAAAFDQAVEMITTVSSQFLSTLRTNAPSRNREYEALKAKERSLKRFGVDRSY